MITTYSPTVITSLYFCCFLPALYWRAHVQLFLLCWVWSITTGMSVGAYQCSTEGRHPPTLKAHRQREDTYIHTHLPHTQPATSTRQPFGDREQVGQLESLGSPPTAVPSTQMRAKPCIIGFLIYELLILVPLWGFWQSGVMAVLPSDTRSVLFNPPVPC